MTPIYYAAYTVKTGAYFNLKLWFFNGDPNQKLWSLTDKTSQPPFFASFGQLAVNLSPRIIVANAHTHDVLFIHVVYHKE